MKTLFITNRGGTHPNRLTYFKSIGADFQFVDFILRWHGISNSKLKMLLSGVICAFLFPNRKQYDLFVTSDPQLPVILMKIFRLLRKDQKVVSYLGSQTLYFIESKYYSKLTRVYYRFLLRNYDAHICNGELQARLLKQVAQVPVEKIYINFNGINAVKVEKLKRISYQHSAFNLLFIGNIYSEWRIHYKGLDLVLDSFNILKRNNKNLTLTIVGECDKSVKRLITKKIDSNYVADVKLVGAVDDITKFLGESFLYVHPSRGDALPNSLTEALFFGLPAVVTNLTGGCELIQQIDDKMVCEPELSEVVHAIMHFVKLPSVTKIKYSNKAKILSKDFTENAAIEKFQSIIGKIKTR